MLLLSTATPWFDVVPLLALSADAHAAADAERTN